MVMLLQIFNSSVASSSESVCIYILIILFFYKFTINRVNFFTALPPACAKEYQFGEEHHTSK